MAPLDHPLSRAGLERLRTSARPTALAMERLWTCVFITGIEDAFPGDDEPELRAYMERVIACARADWRDEPAPVDSEGRTGKISDYPGLVAMGDQIGAALRDDVWSYFYYAYEHGGRYLEFLLSLDHDDLDPVDAVAEFQACRVEGRLELAA